MKKSSIKDKKLFLKKARKAKRRLTRLAKGKHNYLVNKSTYKKPVIITTQKTKTNKLTLWGKIKIWLGKINIKT